MLVPFEYYSPTEKERHAARLLNSMNKAKHLSERMRLFLQDLDKSKFAAHEKEQIINELTKFQKKMRYERDTYEEIVQTWGKPIMRFKPHGKITEEQRFMCDVPCEIIVCTMKNRVDKHIVFGRYGKRDSWTANVGQRLVIRELIRQNKKLHKQIEEKSASGVRYISVNSNKI